MKKENESVIQEKFKTLIGGQALIEGIMMQGPDKRKSEAPPAGKP